MNKNKKGLTTEEKNIIKLKNKLKKVCSKCNKEQLINSFSCKKEKNNLWYFSICNKCTYKRKLERMSNDDLLEYKNKQLYKEKFTIEGRASMLRNRCKQRSKRNNLEFSLSKELIIKKLKKGICEKTNINLIINDSKYNPYSPSIDRIDNNKGYIDDNIQITCMIYNFCKNKFSEDEVNKFFKDIKL